MISPNAAELLAALLSMEPEAQGRDEHGIIHYGLRELDLEEHGVEWLYAARELASTDVLTEKTRLTGGGWSSVQAPLLHIEGYVSLAGEGDEPSYEPPVSIALRLGSVGRPTLERIIETRRTPA